MNEPTINVSELFSIAGKVALVTGGSRGIGLMIARLRRGGREGLHLLAQERSLR